MPELPEVETFRKYIEGTSLQQKIVGFDCADTRLLKKDREVFEEALIGQSFVDTQRIGKYLFLLTNGDDVLVMHFGMTGRPAYFRGLEERPKYAHIIYQFENDFFLGFQNKRKFGWNDLTRDISAYQQAAGLSEDARSLSYTHFLAAVQRRKTYIKPVLMDQSVAAGIGNWMADEILYQAQVHPEKKVEDLDERHLQAIFEAMKRVIETAIDKEANYSDFPSEFFIHIRKTGESCHHTEGHIEKLTVGGRSTYYSPEWQQL
ncbi:MAG: DNA-formamidopyrimidine glycosylase family protein [Bacteroidota bacterium]